MIPKPSKVPNSSDGCNPITLIPALSKVFEKLILSKIHLHLNSIPLHKHQFGFRKKHSPEKCANYILSHIQHERKKFTYVSVISFDISGAFDHAWWPLLIHRFASFNPPRYLLSIVKSYLTDRSLTFVCKKPHTLSSAYRLCTRFSSWTYLVVHPVR